MNFQSKDNRELDVNELARVYRNLNNGKISVQQKVQTKKGKQWRVVGYVDGMQLTNVTSEFNRTKQKQAVAEKVRNVHAFIVGYPNGGEMEASQTKELTYNPFKYSEFVDRETKENFIQADALYITKEGKMYYK